MRLTREQELALVPELPDWNNGKGIDLDGWAQCTASSWSLIGASLLLWPDFYVFDGCVFRDRVPDEANYQDWMGRVGGDRGRVEAVLNHRHVSDEFQTKSPGSLEAQVRFMGTVMASMLRAKLAQDFPDRTFEVSLDCEWTDEIEMLSVTFFQVGRAAASPEGAAE